LSAFFDQFGPTYSLYGVISHAGSGPNQGHYYAHVKSSRGRWYEMNDELVSELRQPPLGIRNAYILFYVRQPGSALLSAIHQPMLPPLESPLTLSAPAEILSAKDRAEKRKRDQAVEGDEEEDVGVKTSPSTLGPSVNGVSSPGSKKTRFNENEADPAALSLRAKIMAVVSGTASGLDTGASGTSPSASKSDAARPNGAPIASECVRELPDADEKEMFGPSRSQTNDDPSTPPRPADDIPSVPLSEDVAPSSMPSLPSPSSRLPLELPSPSPNTTNNLDAIPPTSFYGTSTSGSNSNPKHQFSRVANENDRPYSKHRHYAPPHRHRRSGDIENDRHDGRHRGRHYSGANPYNALGGTFSSAGGGSSKLAGGGMRQRMKKRRPMM
jgi:ubiquitin carboxyl-terminal hydrolase 36/42